MTMKTKRIASLLLSAALLLSLAVPAFAENPTTEETAEPETAVQEVEPEALTEEDAVAPVAEPTAKKEYTYVAIGDSVTAGVGLSGLQYKLVQNGFDMSGNYKGYDGQCFVGYVADQLGLDRDHAINLGLPAVMTKDLADLIDRCHARHEPVFRRAVHLGAGAEGVHPESGPHHLADRCQRRPDPHHRGLG